MEISLDIDLTSTDPVGRRNKAADTKIIVVL